MKFPEITKNKTIAEILEIYPNAEQIMTNYGLHCTSCAGAAFETVENGVATHGISGEDAKKIFKEVYEKYQSYQQNINNYGISITDEAIEEVKDIIKEEGHDNVALQINSIKDETGLENYAIDFIESPKDDPENISLEINGLNVTLPKDKQEKMKGLELAYICNDHIDGFKITQPKMFKS